MRIFFYRTTFPVVMRFLLNYIENIAGQIIHTFRSQPLVKILTVSLYTSYTDNII